MDQTKIGKFIAENENNRFVQLNTNERYNIWKDTKHVESLLNAISATFPRWMPLAITNIINKGL